MRRLALSAGVVVVLLVLQLTLVDRLSLPGGGAPDLVLLVVVALGLTGGPVAGMLTGFWAGLALDVAPPASQVLGEHALVFCVVGYGCGRLSMATGRSAASSLGVAVVAAAAGEALYAAVGLMLGDPGVSWPAIRTVLPSSVLLDILVSPFVVYPVWKAGSWAAGHSPGSAAGGSAAGGSAAGGAAARALAGAAGAGRGRLAGRPALSGWPGRLGRASRLAGLLGSGRGRKAGAADSVRFGKAAARQGDGWVGSGPRSMQAIRAQVRRGGRLRLRPGAGQAGSAAAVQVHRPLPARPVSLRMGQGRRGDGKLGIAHLGGAPGQRYPRGAAGRPARRPRFRPAGGSLGGSLGGAAGRAGPGGHLPGGQSHRGAVTRPLRLHLGGGRRGDGIVAGRALRVPPGSASGLGRPRRRPRLFPGRAGSLRGRPGSPRRQPRFTRREGILARRERSFPRRQPRFRRGRPSFLAGRARSGAGGRSPAWRAGGWRSGRFR